MKIVKLQAENIKRLKAVEINPDGNIIEIVGPNGSGKSSVLDAIFFALAGASHIPTQVVRQGEEKAYIKLDLGELIVTRFFQPDGGTRLVVESSEGARFPSPQAMLDGLIGSLTFDPLAFTRLAPREQLERLKSLVNLDLSKFDGEILKQRELLSELRRLYHSTKQEIMIFAPSDSYPTEFIDVGKLNQEIDRLNRENISIIQRREKLKSDQKDNDQQLSRAKEMRAEADRLKLRAEDLMRQAQDLEDRVIELASNLDVDIPELNDTSELQRQRDAAQQHNNQYREGLRLKDRLKKKNELEKSIQSAQEIINRETENRQRAITSATMPVEGLSFADDEVLFNGLPLINASSAEQLKVSTAIAMASNPRLRVLRIKDGSLLDGESMRILADIVTNNDFQLWIERVESSDQRPCIVMEDGTASNNTPSRATCSHGVSCNQFCEKCERE